MAIKGGIRNYPKLDCFVHIVMVGSVEPGLKAEPQERAETQVQHMKETRGEGYNT